MFIPQDRLDKMQAIRDILDGGNYFWVLNMQSHVYRSESKPYSWYFDCRSDGNVFITIITLYDGGREVTNENIDSVFLTQKDAYIEARRRIDDKIKSLDNEVTA